MYKLFLCLRYLRRRRIAFFAVAAVCLCVAMVLIVWSVMGGFLQMVKDRSRGMLGDLVVENGALQGFPFYEEFIERMKKDLPDEIHEATPVIITYGVVKFPRDQIIKPVSLVGIRLDETCEVNDFRNGLFYEKYYPGTTTLGPQKEPAWGYARVETPDSVLGYKLADEILPRELEQAWQSFKSQASKRDLAEAPIDARMPYRRPGYFRQLPEDRLDTQNLASFNPDPDWLGPELPGVILGTDLCAKRLETGEYERYYWRGDQIILLYMPFGISGGPEDATGVPREPFRYADDHRTGIYEIDSMSVYLDFDKLQRMVRMSEEKTADSAASLPARTTQVQIKLTGKASASRERINEARGRIQGIWDEISARRRGEVPIRNRALLDYVQIQTWEEKQSRFIAAVEKEKYLVTILFGVISLVAVFLVGCIFYMIVQQKTRDIGVVKSIGATAFGVASIFLAYGAAVGVVGGALGSIIGTVFVWYINEFQDLLARISPQARIWSPEVYSFARIPNHVDVSDAVVIYAIAIVASMIGSVIAAVRASRIWPVEALRYE
ncbi:MAG TPA: FtsX-like permease family protein [Phycisphaerae bacterium]|nr:FtsX-like permease family protein [Phycisphaerae bacterium]